VVKPRFVETSPRLGAVDADCEFSLVTGDVAFRLQRAIGLIPFQGLGVGRRALLAVAVTWLPIVVAAAAAGRLWPGAAPEPLLQHFGVHVRFLLAVPLLIVGEALLHSIVRRLTPEFVHSGLVGEADHARFAAIVRRTIAWRDGWQPWLVMAVLVIAWCDNNPAARGGHELLWAAGDSGHRLELGFGVFWFRFVAQPIFIALVLAWLWRLALIAILMVRISRLDLALVATHADRVGGLGFLQSLPAAFAPLSFALAAVLASRWAHDVYFHGAPLKSFGLPMAAFAIVMVAALVVPLITFSPRLMTLRRRALFEYGALMTEHGQLVERRWIRGERVQDRGLLSAPELGPVADTVSLYNAVAATSPVPIGKRVILMIVAPILLPMVPLIGIEVPLKEALYKVLTTLL
jgi:hypothetical protein